MNYRDLVEKLSAIEFGEDVAVAPATNSYIKPKPGEETPSAEPTAVDPATAKTSIIPGQQPDIGHGSKMPPGAPITPQGATPAAPVNPNSSQANDIKNQISAMQNALMALRNPTATAPTPAMQPTTNASVGQQAANAAQKAATLSTQAKPGEPTRPILEANPPKPSAEELAERRKAENARIVALANKSPQDIFKGEMWFKLPNERKAEILTDRALNPDALRYYSAERALANLPANSPEREAAQKKSDAAYSAWSTWRTAQLEKEGGPNPPKKVTIDGKEYDEGSDAAKEAERKFKEKQSQSQQPPVEQPAPAAETEVQPKKFASHVTSSVGMGSKDKPNDAVKKMQQQLIDAGYELPKFGADGIFRGETQRALARFQRDNKLKDQKGIAAGKETNPVLAKVAAEKKAKTADAPQDAPAEVPAPAVASRSVAGTRRASETVASIARDAGLDLDKDADLYIDNDGSVISKKYGLMVSDRGTLIPKQVAAKKIGAEDYTFSQNMDQLIDNKSKKPTHTWDPESKSFKPIGQSPRSMQAQSTADAEQPTEETPAQKQARLEREQERARADREKEGNDNHDAQVKAFLDAHPGVTYNKANGQFKDEKGAHLGSWNPSTNPATNQIYGIDISARKDFKTAVPGVYTGVETPAEPAAASTANNRSLAAPTSNNGSVSGTLLRGKADGAITYNGKTINPGDPSYAEAEQALIDTKKTQDAARAASELQAAQDETARWKSSFKPTHIAPNRFTRGGTELRQNAGGEWIDKDGNRWEKPFLGRDPEAIPPPSGSSPVIPRAVPPGQQSSLDTPSNSVAGLTKDESDAMVRQSTLAERRVSLNSVVDELLNEDWKGDVKNWVSDAATTADDWARGTTNYATGGAADKLSARINSLLPGGKDYETELGVEKTRSADAEKRSPRAYNAIRNTAKDPLGTVDDAVRSGTNTLTFGAPDYLNAATNLAINKVTGAKDFDPEKNPLGANPKDDLGLAWDKEKIKQFKASDAAKKRSPAASEVGSFGGNVVGLGTGIGLAKMGAKTIPSIVGSVVADTAGGMAANQAMPNNPHTWPYGGPPEKAPERFVKSAIPKEDISRITKLAGLKD